LETYATEKARGSLKLLMALIPREAMVKRNRQVDNPCRWRKIQIGEVVYCTPGEKVSLDGTVVMVHSTVESRPSHHR
jgi:cation transport ATPase